LVARNFCNTASPLIVNAAGNVGIGTTSPAWPLDVNGIAKVKQAVLFEAANSTNRWDLYTNTDDTFRFNYNGAGNDEITITSGGNVGIGAPPASWDPDAGLSAIQLNGYGAIWNYVGTSSASGSARAVFQGNNFSSGQPSIVYFQRDSSSSGLTAGAAITYLPFADNAGGIYGQIACLVDGVAGTNDYPGRLTFSTTPDGASSPTERMRITNSGYTIHHAPGWVLEVATAAASGTTDRLIYGVSERAAAGAGGGNQVFIVYSNGNVVNFNNSYGSISDIKLKENIVDAHSQWDDLKALQVRNYNFKEGQTHTQIGLVAQEVELVSPGLVSESPDRDEDGNDLGTVTKSVNYSVLYMKAVKALQEAMERIETLEGMVAVNNITIDEQQHQLSTLAARLTALESA
jgi:hypothetical protein